MTPRQVYYTDNVMPAIFKKETKVIKLFQLFLVPIVIMV